MRNVSICPRTYGFGHVLVEAGADSRLRTTERRVSRTATLDGSVAIDDNGFADGDRTMVLVLPDRQSTKATIQAIETLRDSFNRVTVATDEGVFEALITRLTFGTRSRIEFMVSSKLSA